MVFEKPCLFSTLIINELRLATRLGCSPEEQHSPQTVFFDIHIRFPGIPSGCETDHLEETICYAKISELVGNICRDSQFQLIEKLGWTVYNSLKTFLPATTLLWIRATKANPPILAIQGGASFCVGDWQN